MWSLKSCDPTPMILQYKILGVSSFWDKPVLTNLHTCLCLKMIFCHIFWTFWQLFKVCNVSDSLICSLSWSLLYRNTKSLQCFMKWNFVKSVFACEKRDSPYWAINHWSKPLYVTSRFQPITLILTLPGPSAGVSGSLDSYCSLKPLCSGMGEVVPARTSPTLLPPSPCTVLSLSCFKVLQCINCHD